MLLNKAKHILKENGYICETISNSKIPNTPYYAWNKWNIIDIQYNIEDPNYIKDYIKEIKAKKITGTKYSNKISYLCKKGSKPIVIIYNISNSYLCTYSYTGENSKLALIYAYCAEIQYRLDNINTEQFINQLKTINYKPDYKYWINEVNSKNSGLIINNVEYNPENTIINAQYTTKAYGDSWHSNEIYQFNLYSINGLEGGSVEHPNCTKYVNFKSDKRIPSSLTIFKKNGWGNVLLLPSNLFLTSKITFNIIEEGD